MPGNLCDSPSILAYGKLIEKIVGFRNRSTGVPRERAPRPRLISAGFCAVVIVLAAVGAGCNSQVEMQQMPKLASYSADFRVMDYCLCLPVSIEEQCGGSPDVYRNPTLGVKIDSFMADGHLVTGFLDDTLWYYFDVSEMTLASCLHSYQVVAYRDLKTGSFRLLSVSAITEDRIEVVAFDIPFEVQRIEIEYRARYPHGDLGKPIKVVATRCDS